MVKKKKEARTSKKILLIGISLIVLVGFVFLVSALTSDDKTALQSELDNLTSSLSNDGYSWLIDYNLSYPSVEVYRENDNRLLATFTNISEENWHKIFLTNLSENESYDVFDLKVNGAVRRISQDALDKKMRIDEIGKELKNGGEIEDG